MEPSYNDMQMIASSYGELIFDWHDNYAVDCDKRNHYTALYDLHGVLTVGNTSEDRLTGLTNLYNMLHSIVETECLMVEMRNETD
jgi:hypothetical protein